ncbi:hypothetical protein ISS07_03445 [Candidatus Woesearchaeota archaeon]|nr:hypothetical protein [Candidatus Woesearchaeota archaeon]
MEVLEARFGDVSSYLQRASLNGHLPENRGTEKGIFAPSQTSFIYSGFQTLIDEGIIDVRKYFLDAGSGYGTVCFVASDLDLRAIGIECDLELVTSSIELGEDLVRVGALKNNPPRFIQGDFSEDSNYYDAGIDFSEIGTFFNYFSNPNGIASKIARDSPEGVIFVYYNLGVPAEFEGLKSLGSMDVLHHRISMTFKPHNEQDDAHLYCNFATSSFQVFQK